MTALPQPTPAADFIRPMTVDDYIALPESSETRIELQEGSIVMTPRPALRHQRCLLRLAHQLAPQIPNALELLLEVDLDLQLNPPEQPATIRVPDLLVVPVTAYDRVDGHGDLLTAGDVVLAIEIHSPGTHRTDTHVKHAEYADAGIGHYWMIDLIDGPSLVACHSGGEFGYVDAEPVKGVFETDIPFPARIDLTHLV